MGPDRSRGELSIQGGRPDLTLSQRCAADATTDVVDFLSRQYQQQAFIHRLGAAAFRAIQFRSAERFELTHTTFLYVWPPPVASPEAFPPYTFTILPKGIGNRFNCDILNAVKGLIVIGTEPDGGRLLRPPNYPTMGRS